MPLPDPFAFISDAATVSNSLQNDDDDEDEYEDDVLRDTGHAKPALSAQQKTDVSERGFDEHDAMALLLPAWSVYYRLQPLFVCGRKLKNFNANGIEVNADALLQFLISEGFVFEFAGPYVAQNNSVSRIITFTDRSLNELPKPIARYIQGPLNRLITEIEKYKDVVRASKGHLEMKASSTSARGIEKQMAEAEKLTETCTTRLYMKFIWINEPTEITGPASTSMIFLSNYLFTFDAKEMTTSFIFPPSQLELHSVIKKFGA